MIIVFPMLTSSTVSPAVLPGITIALERYLIIYHINYIIDVVSKRSGQRIELRRGGKLSIKEFVEPPNMDTSDPRYMFLSEAQSDIDALKDAQIMKAKEEIAYLQKQLQSAQQGVIPSQQQLDRAWEEREIQSIVRRVEGGRPVTQDEIELLGQWTSHAVTLAHNKNRALKTQALKRRQEQEKVKRLEQQRDELINKANKISDKYDDLRSDTSRTREHRKELDAIRREAERLEKAAKEADLRYKEAAERRADEDQKFKRERQAWDKIDKRRKEIEDTYKKAEHDAKQRKERKEKATATFEMPPNSSLEIAPSYVPVDTPEGRMFIAIKVLPIPVKSDARLVELLVNDQQLSKMEKFIVKHSRNVLRKFHKFIYSTLGKVPVLGGLLGLSRSTIKGDPKWDIIMSRSEFKDNVFILVNQMDLSSEFFKSAGGINKLFSLGWSSIVATDDVNKTATFCMKKYKGVCSVLPYSYIFSSVGHSKVYQDLDDVRKSGGPIFSLKGRADKMLKENEEVIHESIESMAKKIDKVFVTRFMGSIKAAIKSKDLSKASRAVSMAPKMDQGMINKIGMKSSKEYSRTNMLVGKVLENSTSLPSSMIGPVSSIITFMSISQAKGGDPMPHAKKHLKLFVDKFRKAKLTPEQKVDVALFCLMFFAVAVPASILLHAVMAGGLIALGIIVGLVALIIVSRSQKEDEM